MLKNTVLWVLLYMFRNVWVGTSYIDLFSHDIEVLIDYLFENIFGLQKLYITWTRLLFDSSNLGFLLPILPIRRCSRMDTQLSTSLPYSALQLFCLSCLYFLTRLFNVIGWITGGSYSCILAFILTLYICCRNLT